MKIPQLLGAFLALFTAFSNFNCTHHYYTPALPNVPLLSQAGDCMVSAGVSIQEQATGGAVQASYSPLNHWFLSGDFMWSKPSEANSFYNTETISGKANQYSVGAGWYYLFSDVTEDRGFHFSAMAAYGAGKYDYQYFDNGYEGSSSLVRSRHLYIQPAVAWRSPHFDFILSGRQVWLNYHAIRFNNTNSSATFPEEGSLRANRVQSFFEPGITLRAGWPNLKFQCSYTFLNDGQETSGRTNLGFSMVVFPTRKQ